MSDEVKMFIDRWNLQIEDIKNGERISKQTREDILDDFKTDRMRIRLTRNEKNKIYLLIQDCEVRLKNALNLKVDDESFLLKMVGKLKEFSIIKSLSLKQFFV